MADIDRIRGPSGPPSSGPKKEREVDGHKFRETMNKRKIQKTSETDPEEQRKRKRREEAEEEQKAAASEAIATPQAAPKGGEPSSEREFKVKETGAGAGVSKSGVGAGAPAAAASSESEEAAPPQEPTEPYPISYTYGTRTKETEKDQQTPPPAEAKKPNPAKKGEIAPQVVKGAAHKERAAVPAKNHGKVPSTPHKEKRAGVFEAHRKAEETKAPRVEEKTKESPLPQGSWETTRAIEKKKEKETEPEITTVSGVIPTPVPGMPEIAISGGPLPPYTMLPNPMPHLFDRMVGGIEVLYYGDSTETTITLNAKEFEKSVFYGSQIVITESSSARKEYNIKVLTSTGQAFDLLNNQKNLNRIMTSFETGNYPFKVRRFETGLLTEETTQPRPTKRRKVTKSKKTEEE